MRSARHRPSISCVTNRMVWPVAPVNARNSSCRPSRVATSSALNGSSIRRMAGFTASARAGDTLALAARQLPGIAVGEFGEADDAERGQRAACGASPLERQLFETERGVRENAPPRQHPRSWNTSAMSRSKASLRAISTGAVRGRGQSHQDPQQRRLADARRSDDGDEFAARNREVETLQNLDSFVAFAEGDADVVDADDVVGHHAFHASRRDCAATNNVSTMP